MDSIQLFELIKDQPLLVAIIIIAATFIKIPKVELNIWSLIGSELMKPINVKLDILENKIEDVEKTLNNHITESEIERAITARSRILRFNDEIISGQEHTKEHYEDILNCIDKYDKYCACHPEFPNSKCILACQHIKDVYCDKMEKDGFVEIERLVNVTKENK